MNIFPLFFAAAKIGIGRGSFYFATTKIGIGRGSLLRLVGCGRDRCHSGGFLLRIMPPSWHPVPRLRPTTSLQAGRSTMRQRPYAGGTVLFAAKKIRIGRVIVATTSFRRRAVLLAGTIALHRFSISSPDLRIAAA